MAEFEFRWERPNPPVDDIEQEPTAHICRQTGGTAEKALAKILASGVFYPGELDGFELTVVEFAEDGDPI